MHYPILYSFRRCPYAMRARMALYYARIKHEHREVVLRDKPAHMLQASPKGTVPVLLLPPNQAQVIDESLDIMLWALSENDPQGWLAAPPLRSDTYALIERNDTQFKHFLDRYKYPNKYTDEETGETARDRNIPILKDLNARIAANGFLSGTEYSLADAAIFPFIRQFAHVDQEWFSHLSFPELHKWLEENKTSPLFESIMKKHEKWPEKTDSKNEIIISFQ
ncbi:MAG: glutathione S-transferase [Alphaproteobacteria bacterium]